MDGDESAPLWRALCRYVSEVAVAVGVGPEACCCSPDVRANAYIAVEHRIARYPKRDVALLWDEESGWSVAVETGCGEDLIVLRYLDGDVLPEPAVVARFLDGVVEGHSSGTVDPPTLRRIGARDDFVARLEHYALSRLAPHPIG